MTDTFVEFRKILSGILHKDERYVSPTSQLLEDLGVDSVHFYQIAAEFDNRFDINVSVEVLETFVTVGDVVRFLELRLSGFSDGGSSPAARRPGSEGR